MKVKSASQSRKDSSASSTCSASSSTSSSPSRPAQKGRTSSSSSSSKSAAPSQPLQCANCGTSTTPVWRRDSDRRRLCNACGLYFKSHKTSRGSEVTRPGSQSGLPFDTTTVPSSSQYLSNSPQPSLPGAIQLPVIPRWPAQRDSNCSYFDDEQSVVSVPSHPIPQRSNSYGGSSSGNYFSSSYKLAPLTSSSSNPLTGPSGIIDDLPPLSLPSSSSLSSSNGTNHFVYGASSWGSGAAGSSTSSNPMSPDANANEPRAHRVQSASSTHDFVGASIGSTVRPISSFFRQNSVPAVLPPLSTSQFVGGMSIQSQSIPSALASSTTHGLGDFSFSGTTLSNEPHGAYSPAASSSGNTPPPSTSGGWFLDPMDQAPPTTASSSYSTSSSASGSFESHSPFSTNSPFSSTSSPFSASSHFPSSGVGATPAFLSQSHPNSESQSHPVVAQNSGAFGYNHFSVGVNEKAPNVMNESIVFGGYAY